MTSTTKQMRPNGKGGIGDGDGGDNWSYKTCKAPITTNKPTASFSQAGCPSCRPTNSVGALKGNDELLTSLATCISEV